MTRPALAALVASLTAFTPTPQSDDFPSGNGIGTVGGTTQATLDPGQAFDNVYTVHFFVTQTINGNSTTYGSVSLAVAIETNDGSGWVERATWGNSCGYPSGPPPYATKTCTWAHEQVSVTVAGLGMNSLIRLKAKTFTVTQGLSGSFGLRGGDGTGSNPETYNGVTYSYDPTPTPAYTVAVTPDGGSQTAYVSSTGNVATFSVQNMGNQDGVVYNLSVVGCTAPLTNCTSDAPSVTANHGATVPATVHFNMQGTLGTGTITLRATHAVSGATNDGTINVTALSAAVEVGPDPGTKSVGAGNTAQVATFTVTNNGNMGAITYALSVVTCGAPLINCTSDLASVSVNQGATVNATVHFDATSTTGTGAILLRATHAASGATNDGTINVTVNPPSYAVEVGPDPGSQGAPIESSGNFVTFTVQNLGNQGTLTYQLSIVGCMASVINCTSDAVSIVVGQGATQNATVHFDTRYMTGPGAIVLRATHSASGASNDGTINVTTTLAKANDFLPGNGIATVDQTVEANLAPGNATGGIYTAHYSVSLTINAHSSQYGFATLVIAFESNDGSGWVERATSTHTCSYLSGPPPYASYTCPTWTHEVQTFTAPGLGRDADIRMRAKSFSTNNGAGGSFVARGGDGSAYNGVTYNTDAPPSYILTRVQNGVLNLDSRFLLQETANSYEAGGRVAQLTNARSNVTTLQYGGNTKSAFLTEVRRVKDATGLIDFVTTVKYRGGLVDTIIDEAGARRSFTYDAFRRLRRVANSGNVVVRAYGYVFSRTSANGWVFQAVSPNYIVDSTFVQQTPSVVAVVSTGYIDGLGRPIQTVVQDGTNYHVTATQYDALGRVWRSWTPYRRPTAGFDAAFTATATDSANLYYSSSSATPYIETQYWPDPFNRVSKVIPQYIGSTPTIWTATAYDVNAAAKHIITETTDPSGKKKRRSTDLFGNLVQSIRGYGATEATTTQFVYDVLGQRTQVTDPRGLITTYAIDTRGLLTSSTTPDAGAASSKYDRAGNRRFVQDANQATAGQVYFTNYDFAGRPLGSGQGAAGFGALNADVTETFEASQANWLVVRAYDLKPSTAAFPWSQFSVQISPLTLTNVSGRVAAIASKSNGAWQATLFSYDGDGQVATRYTYTQANSGTTVLTAANATVTYMRDLRGAVTRRFATIGVKTFYQWYDYDGRGLLTKTFASTSSTKPSTADASDTYRPGGDPQNYQFSGGPLVPIRYTIRGQTEKIGDPAVTTYPFSARYAYQANGMVDTAEFYSAGSPAAQKRYRYAFGAGAYDALNQLKSADFSSWSGTAWATTANYDLAAISYDPSGNLLTLRRNRETGTLIDNLTYSIAATSNRLSAVTDAVAATAETWDAETGSITYDANGNMLTAPAPYSITAVSYDRANLPLSITRGGTTTKYRYDDAGERIVKQVGTGNVEVYIGEGSSSIGVFTLTSTGTLSSWYFNLIWQDRVIGRVPGTGARSYYHFDALGSTRAVTQSATVTESYDFEPWGLLMPGRTRAGTTKEGFTGKEQDGETGLDYFGTRYYMPALARWTTVDPLAEKYPSLSAYHYSGNNPLGYRDVDGSYYIGTDGKPVVVTFRNGTIRLSSNAAPDLRRMARLINQSGSATAASQFVAVGNNETKVHFRISQDLKTTSDGRSVLLGLHQAHDPTGKALEWNAQTRTFEGTPAFTTDAKGKLIYQEATITVYEHTISEYAERGLSTGEQMVIVDAHENEHDLNTEDIQSIKDRGEGKSNDRDVEQAAGEKGDQAREEILRKKKRDQSDQ